MKIYYRQGKQRERISLARLPIIFSLFSPRSGEDWEVLFPFRLCGINNWTQIIHTAESLAAAAAFFRASLSFESHNEARFFVA